MVRFWGQEGVRNQEFLQFRSTPFTSFFVVLIFFCYDAPFRLPPPTDRFRGEGQSIFTRHAVVTGQRY